MGPSILVPKPLDGLGPPGDLVNLIQHKDGSSSAGIQRLKARRIPLLFNPLRAAQRRLVGAGVAVWEAGCTDDLLYQRCLAHLARAHDSLKESAGFFEPAGEDGSLGTNEDYDPFAHYYE